MKVFNLTDRDIDYRGRLLGPYQSADYDIGFLPDRDLALQKAGVLAFGSLPKGWVKPAPKPEPVAPLAVQAKPVAPKTVAAPVSEVKVADAVEVKLVDKAEEKDWKKKK